MPPTSTPHTVSAPGVAPILVVSTTHDPATPSRPVSTWPNSSAALLTFDGTQHTVVFQGEECVDKYAAAYLIDLKLPSRRKVLKITLPATVSRPLL